MILTNKLNLPKPFVDAVRRDYTYKPKRYSVTSMSKGVREILLTRRHQSHIQMDVSDMIWTIFGSAVHKVLEDGQEEKDELKETKITIDMPNGYVLSGQQDLYSESLKRITDYKTGTVWKVLFNDWDDYKQQCLIYAWMFRKIGFEVDNAEITMILKDWSKTKAKFERNYPQYPVYVKHFDFTEDDFNEIEKFLIDKFNQIEECEKLSDDKLPLCTEIERWASPTQYAVTKFGNKKALKVFNSLAEAANYSREHKDTFVEERKGTDKKCTEYCSCCAFCKYYKQKYGNT